MAEWLTKVRGCWPSIRILSVETDKNLDHIGVGDQFDVSARVQLGELHPDEIKVEFYFGRLDTNGALIEPAVLEMGYVGNQEDGSHLFHTTVRCTSSGRFGYTLRVRPYHPHLPEPFLPGLIVWAQN